MGKVFKYGENVDTDVIIPARHLNTSDPAELAKHCMEDIDADFVNKVRVGDIIVAGKNFGCGSSREHAPIAIKASGVSCVIAPTFARIFYRNSFNTGLPILECEEAAQKIDAGDEVEVNFKPEKSKILRKGKPIRRNPFRNLSPGSLKAEDCRLRQEQSERLRGAAAVNPNIEI
jgi:3-isopropylmalate/(R)-2-methylmalate dehydratase small subunit